MADTLDYAVTCGYCSTALNSPPRDGADSVCAYLHTRAGRRDFERTLKRNRATKRVVEQASVVTPPPDGRTETPDGVTEESEIEHGVTLGVTSEDDGVTEETKQQRHYRINRERINQERRDRRNHVRCDEDGCLICA